MGWRLLSVALGGAIGASGRYLLGGFITRLTHEHPFPLGTLVINVSGALVIGVILGGVTGGRLALSPTARSFLTIGVLGGYTTFSSLCWESLEAMRVGDVRMALANVALSLLLGLSACWLGVKLGENL